MTTLAMVFTKFTYECGLAFRRNRSFSLHHAKTSCKAQPAFHPLGTVGPFPHIYNGQSMKPHIMLS